MAATHRLDQAGGRICYGAQRREHPAGLRRGCWRPKAAYRVCWTTQRSSEAGDSGGPYHADGGADGGPAGGVVPSDTTELDFTSQPGIAGWAG